MVGLVVILEMLVSSRQVQCLDENIISLRLMAFVGSQVLCGPLFAGYRVGLLTWSLDN
ncbi:hypothetical protein VFPPC_18725 [Pochonia chlamydosporia 170]|uniref:Uncharacterized protein n=1 Tax=Pochonia chlamydosporia 170 TaxID=1380566 RepID=A0A219AS05_METCM|nr:hypothetical protein VFPPC_18725 [Pochonia chlamydosporia 170]OWT43548.1 hypothetical protein VFPPC_18725 [Pochonia chlamydosporia 170]